MRVLFLIPELVADNWQGRALKALAYRAHLPLLKRYFVHSGLFTGAAFGGTLNIMRHCALVHSLGVDAALVTARGIDTYGRFNVVNVPILPWSDIRPDDVCMVPDFCTDLIERLEGPVIAYLQIPTHVVANFRYQDPRVRLWTDSPFMLKTCEAVYPGKEIAIVPNIVDSEAFPFRPQSEREPGLIFAFPRKGPEFIAATQKEYAKLGGTYWRFELIDGLTLRELAQRMRQPQAFLASAQLEGCALPPQESMAAGIVVVGRSARGANFSMEHRKTAMIAETPEAAAVSLRELEDAKLRDDISRNGHAFIRRYFKEAEPTDLWRRTLAELGLKLPAPQQSATAP